jgi:hypothetical protein
MHLNLSQLSHPYIYKLYKWLGIIIDWIVRHCEKLININATPDPTIHGWLHYYHFIYEK